jgi:TolB-like protein/class 3 adenylate cyclase/Tfp pilus assembly protein PilF
MSEGRIERRLAAILAVDVAGYSRLMGADEEGTLAALRAIRREVGDPKIKEHRGRVVKTTGDGLLVEFASVVDAVRCAVEVQREMALRNANTPPEWRIEFRIGINLGDIIVEDGDIFGDGVNIAARLEALAEPGGICASLVVRDQVRDKLDFSFEDAGEQLVKNIARPVHVFAVDPNPNATRVRTPSGAAASSPSLPPRLSVVVLPFANIGGDPEQEYFADGITESLTTDLSRIAGSFVIGRSTAFTYKGKAVDLKQIGRELNVRYVLEGSVQRGGNRLRLNVQLIDAESGRHLWAERFDKPLADLFDMQDEIVAHLAAQLGTQLVEAEARRAERSPDPDSMDLYFRGMSCIHKGLTAEHLVEADGFLQCAVALDPNNVEALVGKAMVDLHLAGSFLTDDRAARIAAAEANAIKALSQAPKGALAHFVLGTICGLTNRNADAVAECEHALALDRNLAYAHAMIGIAKTGLGRSDEAEGHIREALRLSPRDVMAHHWLSSAGTAKLHLGEDDEAVGWLRRAIDANRNYAFTHLSLAAALARVDRIDEARAAAAAGLALEPGFTIGRLRAGARSDNPVYLAGRERIYEGLRKAGVPE